MAINARAAVRAEIGGVERYARELTLRLPAIRPDRYLVLRPPRRMAHKAGHAWEQSALPLRAGGCGLIYSPANLAPVASRRNVVVIHDAAALRHPEAYSNRYVAYQRRMLPLLARRARLVITVSEFSRGELVDLLGVPVERVLVVPGGVDARFGAPAARSGADAVRIKLALQQPYVLAVGTASSRKRLDLLGPATRVLAKRGIELVLAGSDRGYLRGAETGLRRLGYVEEADLPGLYAGALAVVMPSDYEGFGLPCLEAMASGVPVVAAAAGALPETCGGAALLFDPGNPDQLTAALLSAASDEAERARLIARGLTRAQGFSWDRSAVLTDAALGELLEPGWSPRGAGPRR